MNYARGPAVCALWKNVNHSQTPRNGIFVWVLSFFLFLFRHKTLCIQRPDLGRNCTGSAIETESAFAELSLPSDRFCLLAAAGLLDLLHDDGSGRKQATLIIEGRLKRAGLMAATIWPLKARRQCMCIVVLRIIHRC